jgi:hypothetical protein
MQPTPARSRAVRHRKVVGAARAWLAELPPPTGADQVRAAMLLVLAGELDDPTAPRYSRAKIAGELRATLAELERFADQPVDAASEARRLLALVR